MYYRTRRFIWARTITRAFLAALGTRPAAALLTTPTLILFTNGPTVAPDSDVADYTEATFGGYAGVVLTLSASVNTGGEDWALSADALFNDDGTGTQNEQCLGYMLTDGAVAFYGGEMFPAPISFATLGQFLELDLLLPLPGIFSPSVV